MTDIRKYINLLESIEKSMVTERVLNLFTGDNDREKYKNEVYNLLVDAYAPIGGIKGSGFTSPDDMVANLDMWKLFKKNDKIVVALLYKDRRGRKLVAAATDGSTEAKRLLASILPIESLRSYVEKSKKSLDFYLRRVPNPTEFIIPFGQAKKASIDDIISVSSDWPTLDGEEAQSTKEMLAKYPFLKEYGYFREIQPGKWFFKVMIGTPGLPIY